jgi:UPF0755 protein
MTLTEGPTDWEVDPWDSPAASGSVERLRRQTRVVKWAVWTVMVVVVVLVLVAGRIGWWYVKQINPEGTPGVQVSFTVAEGDTLESLSERLEAEGIIANAGVFRWYVEEKGGLEITPGYYQLRPADHIGNIVGHCLSTTGHPWRHGRHSRGDDQFGHHQAARRPQLDRGHRTPGSARTASPVRHHPPVSG